MGVLCKGTPLSWEETKKYAKFVRECGIANFVEVYQKFRNVEHQEFLWGDEVEYMIVKLDPVTKTARLSLRATEVLNELQRADEVNTDARPGLWSIEYGSFMVESSPGAPYGDPLAFVNVVEDNMKQRREELQKLLRQDEYALTLTVFPRLGCSNVTWSETTPTPHEGCLRSLFLSDGIIQQCNPRYLDVTKNMRLRRGSKPSINIPIYKDTNTPDPFVEDLSLYGDHADEEKTRKPDHIYMDCAAFGSCGCCIQATFQAASLQEAKLLYDNLVPIAPVLIALSAATPAYRGYLSDLDTRCSAMTQALDDRTDEERRLAAMEPGVSVFPKARCGSVDTYLSCPQNNDVSVVSDNDLHEQLTSQGVDELMSRHVIPKFLRDPLMIYHENLKQTEESQKKHLESLICTDWSFVKLKLPVEGSSLGWRVEFRPLEAQLTDAENAAYVTFVALLVRTLLALRLNLLVPISVMEENVSRANKRDAVINEKFIFRKNVFDDRYQTTIADDCLCNGETPHLVDSSLEEMSVNDIINGSDEFPGLIPLIRRYVDGQRPDVAARAAIEKHLNLISLRAAGKLKTTARWMRDFITSHQDYKQDSVVSEAVTFDLMTLCAKVIADKVLVPDLLPASNNRLKAEFYPVIDNDE